MTEDITKYFTSESRFKSFKNFPQIKGAPLCTAENMAAAGFYSTATRKEPDSVKCFACGKQLSNWEEGDDPWQEHIRRGQVCPFVQYKSLKVHTYEDTMKLFVQLYRRECASVLQDCTRKVEAAVETLKENAFDG